MPPPTILVPVAVLEGEVLPDALVEFVSSAPVVLLGYHRIPDQTVPEQARDQFEPKARRELDELAAAFEAYGANVETRLVFTSDVQTTIEQTAIDVDRVAVLLSNPVTTVENVLVAVRGGINVPNIAATVASLVAPTEATVTLYHAATADEDVESARRALSGIATALVDAGIDRTRVTWSVERTGEPLERLVAATNQHDLLVIGEDEPRIADRIFGDTFSRIADRALAPVLVVRRPTETSS